MRCDFCEEDTVMFKEILFEDGVKKLCKTCSEHYSNLFLECEKCRRLIANVMVKLNKGKPNCEECFVKT
jgi:hypothetical protein